ncbi:MAG: hypothetical protein ACE5GC_10525, partial [Acidimicrobiia bacterium]
DRIGVFSQPGALPEQALRSVLTQVLELDMDEVRRSIADEHDADHDHSHDQHDEADHPIPI